MTDRLVSPDILAHVQRGEVRMAKAKKGGESDEGMSLLGREVVSQSPPLVRTLNAGHLFTS